MHNAGIRYDCTVPGKGLATDGLQFQSGPVQAWLTPAALGDLR